MSPQTPLRRPFVEPVVSQPIEALDATRAFGGMLGQVILAAGSSGAALDDGDYALNSYCVDPGYQDGGVDPATCLP